MNSYKGHLLVSRYNLPDPNFHETVVLLVDHNEEGAFGFTLNRPVSATVAEAIPDLHGKRALETSFRIGGPVQTDHVMALHDGIETLMSHEVIAGVYFEPLFENLFPFFQEQEVMNRIIPFAGYAGWGAGQLEAEMEQDTWIVVPADRELVFWSRPEEIWRRALQAKGGLYRVFAETTSDPELN